MEAIVALPTDLFYNTGIQTYVWLLTNRKADKRRGKVQLIDASGEMFWKSMRKSLGSKRREIPEAARHEIVRLYEGFEETKVSKIFDSTAFGYREIKVERPLKLNFEVNPDRVARLDDSKPWQKLPEGERYAILAAIGSLPAERFMSRDSFEAELTRALKDAGLKIGAPIKKAILSALSERDEGATVCTDKKGFAEPDSDLRDQELVPLDEDWEAYVAREVTPFVPDAWVDLTHTDHKDGQVGRVGYEINFNRYFYEYVPPRPLEEIDAELKQLEAEIAELMQGVIA